MSLCGRGADSLHHGVQEVPESLPHAGSDVPSDIQSQVTVRCTLRVNDEFSVRHLFFEELQYLYFLAIAKVLRAA